MDTDRRMAVVAGVLFIVATVADVLSRAVFLTPVLTSPDPLAAISESGDRVTVGVLLLLLGAGAAAGIAIALYPVLRKHSAALALGSVGFRLIEGTLYLGIVVCLLVLVEMSQAAKSETATAASAWDVPAALVLAARDALGEVAVVAFGLGAAMYYSVLYRWRLVPRWLSGWGLLAVAALMVSDVAVLVGLIEPFSPAQIVLALPIGVQEMVLAGWLIARGLSPAPQEAPGPSLAPGPTAGAAATAR
jgi:hypothetical protein